jgi:hypothetical protein
MWGRTFEATMNAALDEIGRLKTERDNAIDELTAFVLEHPEFEDDPRITTARLALL